MITNKKVTKLFEEKSIREGSNRSLKTQKKSYYKNAFICVVVDSPILFVLGLMCLRFGVSWECLSRV